jgi:hypothetical protein
VHRTDAKEPGNADITDLGDDVFQIDTKMAGYQGITAGYLIRSSRPCLVETGTSTSAPVVRAALAALGIDAAELAPVPAGRLRTLDNVGTVDLGDGRRLESHYSPGHAKHHVGLLDSANGDLYVGDAAGVYIPETGDLRPATPPPDFDLDVALTSIGKFASLGPSRLLFSHYGPVSDVTGTLDRSAEEISVWVSQTRAARSAGMDLDHAVEAVRQKTLSRYAAFADDADPAVTEKFDRIGGAAANVAGIWHWLDKLDRPAS